MRRYIGLMIAVTIEFALLIVILALFILGAVGIILPLMPGFLFIGLGIGLYLAGLRKKNSRLFPFFHYYVLAIKKKLYANVFIMNIAKKIKQKREEKTKQQVLTYSAVLCAFNTALALVLFFALNALILMMTIMHVTLLTMVLLPLVLIFIYAAACGVIWYRFGQVIGLVFKKNALTHAGVVVLFSVMPLFMFLVLASTALKWWWYIAPIVTVSFVVTVLLVVLATLFQVFIVSLGAATKDWR